jgi:predicted permease
MIFKILLFLLAIAIFVSLIYDRFTGKRTARKIIWPLAGGLAVLFIAFAALNFLE